MRMAGQGGVVGFQVQFEMRPADRFSQEVKAGRGVGIVLMLGRLLGLRLDVELALEADLLFVVNGHVEKFGQVLQFALDVGVRAAWNNLRVRPRKHSRPRPVRA